MHEPTALSVSRSPHDAVEAPTTVENTPTAAAATSATEAHVDVLAPVRDAITAATSMFYVAGEIPVKEPITMVILPETSEGTTTEHGVKTVMFPPVSPGDLSPLIEASKQASFGRGGEEVLDPNYRQALVLKKDRFGTIPHSLVDALVQDILPAIHQGLFPFVDLGTGAQHRIVAELDKLNVYGVGDFFKGHVDTPRSDKMMGTLLINLPVEHEGGNLVIYPNEGRAEPYVTNWGSISSFGWVAFFSDCPHEVLHVTSGNRRVSYTSVAPVRL